MRFFLGIVAILFIGLIGSGGAVFSEENVPPSPPRTPMEVATAYLAAMESSDLDAAEALFAARSSVFESGGDEGTWQHYREHHLGPEIDGIDIFSIKRAEPAEHTSRDRSMALVTWPIEYRIQLHDGRTIESKGTVSFVMEHAGAEYRIRHLHWSSRRKSTDG